MSKFECINKSCTYECKLEITGRREAPKICQYTGQNTHWREVEPASNLPKLTEEVFNRPDCPPEANAAVVTKSGRAYFFAADILKCDPEVGGWQIPPENDNGRCWRIPGHFDSSEWENSIIYRPVTQQEQQGASLTVRFKKLHKKAKAPYQATRGSAGFDLTATSVQKNVNHYYTKYGTGLAVEIPEGHVGLVFPRSSIYKTGYLLSNGVGVIDSDFRGEISAVFGGGIDDKQYKVGDRICQLVIMPIPAVKFVEAEELTETQRGAGGYGSTGK